MQTQIQMQIQITNYKYKLQITNYKCVTIDKSWSIVHGFHITKDKNRFKR